MHLREGLAAPGQSLELSALVLVALGVFAVFVGGRLSIDHHLFRERPTRVEEPPPFEPEAEPIPP